jgi:predicted O-methyltransferase YrrM
VAAVIVTDAVGAYIAGLRAEPDPVLAEMEAHAARDRVPVVPPETGELLHLLALTRGARRIVEVGTAIGMSTLYMARALAPGGELVSFEIDPARHADAVEYVTRAGVADRVDLRLQDAREGLAALDGQFEMAFLDGVKLQYGDYLEALEPLLAPRAVLAIDNMLMAGTVAEGRSDGSWSDDQIAFARSLNARLVADERFSATLLPVGDGLLVAVRG